MSNDCFVERHFPHLDELLREADLSNVIEYRFDLSRVTDLQAAGIITRVFDADDWKVVAIALAALACTDYGPEEIGNARLRKLSWASLLVSQKMEATNNDLGKDSYAES